jgi:hypothetical protein
MELTSYLPAPLLFGSGVSFIRCPHYGPAGTCPARQIAATPDGRTVRWIKRAGVLSASAARTHQRPPDGLERSSADRGGVPYQASAPSDVTRRARPGKAGPVTGETASARFACGAIAACHAQSISRKWPRVRRRFHVGRCSGGANADPDGGLSERSAVDPSQRLWRSSPHHRCSDP